MTSHEHHGVPILQQLYCLLGSLLNLTSKKTSKLHITGPFWGESTRNWWIPLKKGQKFGKDYHFLISSWKLCAHFMEHKVYINQWGLVILPLNCIWNTSPGSLYELPQIASYTVCLSIVSCTTCVCRYINRLRSEQNGWNIFLHENYMCVKISLKCYQRFCFGLSILV